jgi:hypothetical protein
MSPFGVLVFGVWSLFAFCYLFFVISGRGGDENNGHSMGKGKQWSFDGKRRRCVVAWMSGCDKKNVDAWLRGRVDAEKYC